VENAGSGAAAVSNTLHTPGTLVRWLQLNLSVTILGATAISGACGFLIATTARVTTVQLVIEDSAEKVKALQANIVDIDHRLNEISAKAVSVQAQVDQQLADLDKRAEVLRVTLAFVADRTARDPLVPPAVLPGVKK
jgi:peptidoglycan hydrolase CwlO-like protein